MGANPLRQVFVSPDPLDIDFHAFRFPSDRLCLGDLRRHDPDLLDRPRPVAVKFLLDAGRLEDLVLLVNLERQLARRCYRDVADARDTAGGDPETERLGRIVMEMWQEFGLAPGPVFANEMLRDLTAAAAAQARGRLGERRA